MAGYMFIVFFQKVVKVSGASRNLKGGCFKNELIFAQLAFKALLLSLKLVNTIVRLMVFKA